MADAPKPVKKKKTSPELTGQTTIVRKRTLVARGKQSDPDEIRRKAREAEKKKQEAEALARRQEAAERKKRMAKLERRRSWLMFGALLALVIVIFVIDAVSRDSRGPKALEKAEPTAAMQPESREELHSLAEMAAPETEALPAVPDPEPEPEPDPEPEPEPEVILYKDKLAEYFSDGVGSQNRYNNLQVACSLLDGYILEDGEQFSFNEVVGERTAERGFLEASVYTTEEDNLQLGGGICQVASTLYACALTADLQIDERSAHIYTVSYVPDGLDATIDWGHLDLKFTNNTGAPLKIRASAWENGVMVRLFGTNNREGYIKLSSEVINTYKFDVIEKVDYTKPAGYAEWETLPKDGYDVFSYQDIYSADGELLEHRYVATSYYQKIDLVICVGP